MQISEQIIAVLDNLAQKFGIVIDWGQENVIPYIQQLCSKYIAWKITSSILWICFGMVLLIIGCILFKSAQKWHEAYKNDWDYTGMGKSLFIIAAIGCWLITLSIVTSQVFDIVRCCICPELQIFELVQSITA